MFAILTNEVHQQLVPSALWQFPRSEILGAGYKGSYSDGVSVTTR